MKLITFFDNCERLEKVNKLGNPLKNLEVVNWEIFRDKIEKATGYKKPSRYGSDLGTEKSLGGRPAYDGVLMFKILVLQKMYGLSDEQTEIMINDRLSFIEFLGLENRIPDFTTVWKFREKLVKAGVIKQLFNLFNSQIDAEGYMLKEGKIVDATFVKVPKQRNTKEENDKIKENKIPDDWKKEENKNKLVHKDTDARWTQKRGENYFGYKDHIVIGAESKLITDYTVTSANVHDSTQIEHLINAEDETVYADAGYAGTEGKLPEGVKAEICEKGYRGRPLTAEQKEHNREKSRIRCRIEHVFGYMKTSMHSCMEIGCIGIKRVEFSVGLSNLVYNMNRLKILKEKDAGITIS